MTPYETELLAHLAREWEPKYRIAMFSMKTSPLSDECKTAVIALGASVNLVVRFTEEPMWGAEPGVMQHFVNASRTKQAG